MRAKPFSADYDKATGHLVLVGYTAQVRSELDILFADGWKLVPGSTKPLVGEIGGKTRVETRVFFPGEVTK